MAVRHYEGRGCRVPSSRQRDRRPLRFPDLRTGEDSPSEPHSAVNRKISRYQCYRPPEAPPSAAAPRPQFDATIAACWSLRFATPCCSDLPVVASAAARNQRENL